MADDNTDLVNQEKNKPARDEKGRLLPGNTANPNGRPKKKPITEAIEELLGEALPDGKTRAQFIAATLLQMAKDKDLGAIKEITDRVEGKPQQSTDITTKGEPIAILGGNALHSNNSDQEDTETQ